LIEARSAANEQFFTREAERIATLSLRLGERFLAGGRLFATFDSPQDRSDAQHVAVEFVHPVIVGKRALPALAVAPERVELLATPADTVIAFGPAPPAPRECLTIGFAAGAAEWVFEPPSADPFVRQELVETLYHVLWETVHVFLDHLGTSTAGAGRSGFLYPFLESRSVELDDVLADVAASIVAKSRDVGELRLRTVGDGSQLAAAAATVARRLGESKLLAFGNGGSATDAADFVADLADAGAQALDLTADPSILTALANDVGPEVIFQRQVIAHGREGDVAVAFSTSGGSANILSALTEARRRGLATIAFVGYDGGTIVAERLADHVIVAPSEYVPRIQEAHATAYHLVCESVAPGGQVRSSRMNTEMSWSAPSNSRPG
jgi:D-sedoheptulose 7-phosphate isomerase